MPETLPLPITNISCYKFAPLTDLKSLREQLLSLCKTRGLKGTILLSTEGINMFVAGSKEDIDHLISFLRAIPGLESLEPKISDSIHQPFRRMLVRIKREIIAFGVDGVDPARYTSPRVDARTLKQWLDEGRPVTLLDTRNDYEVKLGTFKGALPIGVNHFRDFPEAVRRLPSPLKHQPIVTFCTGGIRCEKAAPFMEMEGFENIYQLDGGILKYFEECGGEHYDGECFVFDQRVGLDPALHETESTQCYACQSPLTHEDQMDPRYVEGVSCPYCFKTPDEAMADSIARRHEAIANLTQPLPGSVPYDNLRPITISQRGDGLALIDFLCESFAHVPRDEWLRLCEMGRLLDCSRTPVSHDHIVHAGGHYFHLLPATREPNVNAGIRILHEDEALVVACKPAPLPMHPSGRFNRNTLQFILNEVYHPQKLRPAHRLDANTTGLVLLARTRHFASLLQPQFSRGEVEKTYLARVLGHPADDVFACDAPISDTPADAGSRQIDEAGGLAARTEFRVLSRDANGTSLLEARPLTGRTNQIRIHLWSLGLPICGDPLYLPDQRLGDTQTLEVGDAPMCLHAWKLGFDHPLSRERITFEASPPEWATLNQ